MKTGDLIVFKGQGLIYRILSRILKWKRPDWDGWGWHVAIAVEYHKGKGWMIAEALAGGVKYSWLKGLGLSVADAAGVNSHGRLFYCSTYKCDYRVISHFTRSIHATELRRLIADDIGSKYDVLAYLWTALQIFMLWFPRILNNRYTCWEFVFWICRELGKPIQPLMKYPNIADIEVGNE